jgi:CBS domain-containing protein
VARKDVPTCSLGERVAVVRERVSEGGWEVCVVVNEERIVLGLLRNEELDAGGDEGVEQVMRPGPSTFRPHVGIEEIAEFMIHHDRPNVPITTSDGRLVGILLRTDAAKAALQVHKEHGGTHEHGKDEDEAS